MIIALDLCVYIIKAVRKLEATQESISDYEKTINKFRELVAQLQVSFFLGRKNN